MPLVIDTVTPINADTVNRLRSAIVNIEKELGVLPSSSKYVDVRARLDDLSSGLSSLIDDVNSLILTGNTWKVVNISSNYVAENLNFILIESSGIEITLPTPVRDFKIALKDITGSPEDIFIKTNSFGVTIDGTDYSSSGLQISSGYEQINLISDGINWFIY